MLQSFVCHDGADAVLAKTAWLDAELSKDVEDRTIDIAVAFELDDDEIAHEAVIVGYEVVEPQISIDGEALGLALVDEGDAIEAVLEML